MNEFLCKKKLWAKLRELATNCSGPRWIATPYLGQSARALLQLKAGDVVICALTEQNVRAGSISPKEIEKLLNKQVKVYTQANLHAKVYFFGKIAVVSSANWSMHSFEHLDETGLLTDDPQVIKEIRQWFIDRFGSLVTPAWLEKMLLLYNTLPGGSERTHKDGRTWIAVMEDTNFLKAHEMYRIQCEKTAEERMMDATRYEVRTTRWDYQTEVQFGDVLIQVSKEDGDDEWTVLSHARVLEVVHFQTPTGRPRAYVCLEMPRNSGSMSYDQFRSECGQVGLKLDDDPNWQEMIEVKSNSQIRQVLKLTTFDTAG